MGLGVVACALTFVSCEDFLDRPTEDSKTVSDYFKNDEECIASVNTLYASPWNDYLRGIYNIGDKLAGNYYAGADDNFGNQNINASVSALSEASNALWCVVAHSNTAITYLKKAGSGVSEAVKNQCIGEAMTMKCMAYFYLVRAWGAVPIIHNTEDIVVSGSSFDLYKYREQDVYDYIINTLVEALNYLPKTDGKAGRIDYYSAEGLLAKVYLQAAAAKDGSLNQACLEKAKSYAEDVILNSGRDINANKEYIDIFRISTGHKNPEGLITLQWQVSAARWTINNWSQPDFVAAVFGGTGNGWGEWGGPSVDLQQVFGVNASVPSTIMSSAYHYCSNPADAKNNQAKDGSTTYELTENDNADVRRQVTMCMYGDYYKYWWRNFGGFLNNNNNDYNVCCPLQYAGADDSFGAGGTTVFSSPTGAMMGPKICYGNSEDHVEETNGTASSGMCGSMPTHLLRLADVYLVYVEACMNVASSASARSTSDGTAIKYFNDVRKRAHAKEISGSISFDELMDERRRELAMEGDNWFDFTRQGDYDEAGAIDRIFAQERGTYNADDLKGVYGVDSKKFKATSAVLTSKNLTSVVQGTDGKKLRLPFPQTDVTSNKHLVDPAQEYDFSAVEYYSADNYKNL